MRLVLEGPDGAGKTTLAQYLMRAHTTAEYCHEGPPPASASGDLTGLTMIAYYACRLREPMGSATFRVHDRWALGERVYGPTFRGHDVLGDAGMRVLWRVLEACDARCVVCLPPFEVVEANWRAKIGDLTKDADQLRRAWDAFQRFSQQYDLDVYDYTTHDPADFFARELEA